MTELASIVAVLIAGAIACFGLDDLFIDLVAIWRRLRPRELHADDVIKIRALPQKRIAILIANWQEEDVLERMVRGNIAALQYQNYVFYLGVYPNDAATWASARRLEQQFPAVSVIVNSRKGPSSKGQLLNEMVRQILEAERAGVTKYDLFLLQDSEDLMHPLSLAIINHEADRCEFIQLPVFSLPVKPLQLVAGVYMDEFAEAHAKEMLVRASLGAPIPSAGVGTAISGRVVRALMNVEQGSILNENCLTEDYQLGLQSARLGFASSFACYFCRLGNGRRDYIATREFFPDSFQASVRQKTRWTVGIAFQSADRFRWRGTWLEKYYLWRDRRGPWNGIMILVALILTLGIGAHALYFQGDFPEFTANPYFFGLAGLNFFQMTLRLISRMRCTAVVYGAYAALHTPLRWPVGNLVNTLAAYRAFRLYRGSVRRGKRLVWVKTQHRLPEDFGSETRAPARDRAGLGA